MTSITPARRGELSALTELLRAEDLHDDLGLHPDTATVVAKDDGVVVGGAALEVYGGSGLLRSLVVARGRRGAGLGRDLVQAVAAEAHRRGLRDLSLLTLTAPAFFEKLGFARVDRSALPAAVQASYEYRVLCPDTALAMVRAL